MDVNNINKINSLTSVNRLNEYDYDHGDDERFTHEKCYDNRINIDEATLLTINRIINSVVIPNRDLHLGELIDIVSQEFLGTPYQANMLIGSSTTPEALVADFRGVDCFTLLDYVLALAKSDGVDVFVNTLVETRYKNGEINYLQRKHFFTDWCAAKPNNATDVTATISQDVVSIAKTLNINAEGKEFIIGLGGVDRKFIFIPGDKIDEKGIGNLQNGDLVGVYSTLAGLDVSHVGIFIKKPTGHFFRNASSMRQNMKVVDSPFEEYFKNKPGVIVLRAVL